MERFVIIGNGFQPLNIIAKHSILDVVAVLDPPLWLKVVRPDQFYWKNETISDCIESSSAASEMTSPRKFL